MTGVQTCALPISAITAIRGITQELDNFNSEVMTDLEHQYVDNRALADEIADALKNINFGQQNRP